MAQHQIDPPPEEGRQNTPILLVVVIPRIACLGNGGIGAYFLTRDSQSPDEEPSVAYILDTSPRMGQSGDKGSRLSIAQAIMA